MTVWRRAAVRAPFRGWVPMHLTQCRLGRGLRTTVPSGILIHPAVWQQYMGLKVGDAVPRFFGAGELGPHLTQYVAWADAYLRTKWHLDPSNRLDTTDMGRKLGAVPFFWGGGAGSPSNRMRPRSRLPPCQVSSCSIQPFSHNTHHRYRQTGHRSDSIGRTVFGRPKYYLTRDVLVSPYAIGLLSVDACLSVCMSCHVCNVGVLWQNGWTNQDETKLGMQVDLGPGHIVLDGYPAPLSPKGRSPQIFGPCLLWPNG